MRYNNFFIYIFFLFISVVNLQAAFIPEGLLISPKLSFSGYSNRENWQDYSISKVPPFAIQIEKYYNSFISYGGYVGVNGENYIMDTNDTTSLKNRSLALATIGTFHYSNWFQRVLRDRVRFSEVDLYCSISLRWEYRWASAKNMVNEETDLPESYRTSKSVFHLGPIFGVRYYISDSFSMLAEVGGGNLGMVTMGVSWRR